MGHQIDPENGPMLTIDPIITPTHNLKKKVLYNF